MGIKVEIRLLAYTNNLQKYFLKTQVYLKVYFLQISFEKWNEKCKV